MTALVSFAESSSFCVDTGPHQLFFTCVVLSTCHKNPSPSYMVLESRCASGDDGRQGGASSSNPLAAMIPAALVVGSPPDLVANGISCPWLWYVLAELVN